MKRFEEIISNCFKSEFKERVEKYFYFDAKEYVSPNEIQLEYKLYEERNKNNDILYKLKEICYKENSKKINSFMVAFDFEKIDSKNNSAIEFYNRFLKNKIKYIECEDINYIIKFYNDNVSHKHDFKPNIIYSTKYTPNEIEINFIEGKYDFSYSHFTKLILIFIFKYVDLLIKLEYIDLNYCDLLGTNLE